MHVFTERRNDSRDQTFQGESKRPKTQRLDRAVSSYDVTPGFSFSRIPVYPASPIGTRGPMIVGPSSDAYELEAERASDQVMQSSEPGPGIRPRISRIPTNHVQRVCTKCEEEKDGKGGGAPEDEIDGHTASAIHAIRGLGAPLPSSERSFFEPRFGHDFSRVRVHTGSGAAGLARSLNARAFTLGQDIVFGAGEYAPGSLEGKKVLAHELAHTMQQGGEGDRLQRLTITQHSLTKGTCGQRNVQWVFSLDKAAPEDGYIVQHIQRGAFINRCPDVLQGPPNVDLSFWEAWKLRKNETVDWTTTRDKWTDGNTRPAFTGTSGTDFADGEVKFFKQSTTGDLGDFGVAPADPKSAWGPGKVAASGALPSTPSEPSWWSGSADEGPAKRSVWANWNCCDADPTKRTYDLTATPAPARRP